MFVACRSWNTIRALTRQATDWLPTSFAPCSHKCLELPRIKSLVKISDRRWNRKARLGASVANRLASRQPNRQHPSPHVQGVVFFVVLHVAGPHLRGNFAERQSQNAGGF